MHARTRALPERAFQAEAAKSLASNLPARAHADILRSPERRPAGGGPYTVQGTTYTEKLDYFSDPAYVGKAVPFTCRTEGDRFYQSGPFPIFEGGKKVRDIKLAEVWKRVE